ncbi:ATP-binding protein [Anaerobium acetethylicum]|uniref:DNA replication protein DnaC n=1 Tax=Anaerobium acetethylicum TaxID=1619234 RepID=A0A1D3TRG5_9FIRM|nr:ATP-binding protein [Anaerobium acetethylicum]SCP96304.1 DNA replication protein DnaC [Anaerobium acetethylicum]
MALKNSQYDAIIREYNQRQLQSRHVQDQHLKEIYKVLPEIQELDASVSSLSVAGVKSILNGNESALAASREKIEQLSRKRKELLLANGYPDDYLDLHYSCSDCMDTGYIGNEKCHCFKQATIDMLYTQSNIKDVLNRENFNTFSYEYYSDDQINPSTGLSSLETIQYAVKECRNFIDTFDTNFRNLLFYGDTGVGKTFLSNCVAKELIDSAHSVIYFSAFQLFDILAKSTFGKDAEADDMNQYIFDCDLLIIDDLGTELTNSFVASQLFLCVNERLLRKKSTIISTNLPIDMFIETYSERTFSRISSNYTMIKLIGDDIRIKKRLR